MCGLKSGCFTNTLYLLYHAAKHCFAWGLILLIRAYQLMLSPLIKSRCRYSPTCSQYAIEAVKRYGALKGSFLALKRISRCHPMGGSGYDPVP